MNMNRQIVSAFAGAMLTLLAGQTTHNLRAQSQNQPAPAAAQSKSAKRPLNQINRAFVITPEESREWHALKDKLGPAPITKYGFGITPRIWPGFLSSSTA